ncbi:ras association domain-containing protein 9 [Protopterus annectens]|uniref:ras association domain-containing protein 9 n=1 Tax=Protopterus annectens TaxID=7888 RepID=UPI001CFA5015|nr:ras association domain-containing protein 9 [Protopterus annectens]XP_043944365.1 ras association domain-containing protein 9 [Protopterus annectens]
MGSGEKEVVVWVCQEEKIVSGLTKYTTCAEVVQALLEDNHAMAGDKKPLLGAPNEYCIVEKWRGFERILPPQTRIWRLWRVWGEEQPNIHFVLVKADAFMPFPPWRTAEAKLVKNKDRQIVKKPVHYIKSLPMEKQKRTVKKAFRKLAKIKQEALLQDRNNMETLVHLIISQDHTIHQQIQRMKELDMEIENYESKMHKTRAELHGVNYVRNTYLLDAASADCKGDTADATAEQCLSEGDAVLLLEEQLRSYYELIEKLSTDIDMETRSAYPEVKDLPHLSSPCSNEQEDTCPETLLKEIEKSRKDTLALYSQLNAVQDQLKQNASLLEMKTKEYDQLIEQVNSVHISDTSSLGQFTTENESTKYNTSNVAASYNFLHKSSGTDMNDTDSDTGISSTHSQDSVEAALTTT